MGTTGYVEHVAIHVAAFEPHLTFFREVLGMDVRDRTGPDPEQIWLYGGIQLICDPGFVPVDGRFAHGRSLRALLYTTTHRLCIDRLRRRTRWVRVRRLFGAAPRTSITPEERVTDGEDRDRLADAIERLPTKHKAAIGLVYDEGLTTEDAAAILDITPTQLRSRLAYARRLIRDHVQQEEAP